MDAEKSNARLSYFLHSQGYTFFSMGKLTMPEIMLLMQAAKEEADEIKRSAK